MQPWHAFLLVWLHLFIVQGENITRIVKRDYPPTTFAGPFELKEAYPAFFYYGNDWSQHTTSLNSPSLVSVNHHGDEDLWKSETDNVPVYLIYYGPTGSFTEKRRDIFETFLENIFTSSYWNVVKEYSFNKKRAGTPKFIKSIFINCSLLKQKCSLFDLITKRNPASTNISWKRILYEALGDNDFRLVSKGIYTIVLDEQVDVGDRTPDIDRLGGRAWYVCSISLNASSVVQTGWTLNRHHQYVKITSSYVSIPNSQPVVIDIRNGYRDYIKPVSNCFINTNNLETSPNGDPGADAAINFMLRNPPDVRYNWRDDSETQDTSDLIVSDNDNNPPTDKCTQLWPNGDYNIQLGNKRYLVNPVWSLTRQRCAMN